MRARSITDGIRRRLALVATIMVAGGLAVVGIAPAEAKGQPALKIEYPKTSEGTYGPIPGQFPIAPTLNWTPSGCTGTATSVCDTVPLDIVVPKLGPADDFYVTIQVSWDDPDGLNDLDVYLWDDRQIDTQAGESSPGFTEVNRSASSSNPEVIKQFAPMLGRYNLTIVNWSGANLGYKVKAFMTVSSFEAPFELLAPEVQPQPGSSTKNEVVAPIDYSATPPPSGGGPIAPTFGEIPVQPDDSLDFGPSDFESAIAAPPAIQTGTRAQRRAPRPVPGAVAAFWLGAVPLLLTGASVALLVRRRRESFAFA